MKRPSLSELSLTEKVAQLLMVWDTRLMYKTVDGETDFRPPEEIDEIMKKCQYGSVWYTGAVKMDIVNLAEYANGRQMTIAESKEYVDSIQKNVRLPMLVGIDAENGLGTSVSGGTVIPTALSIGAANDEKLTAKLSAGVARELRAAGANWRWAPLGDIINRFGAGISRVFSDDVDRLTKLCITAMRATEKEHVASHIKHFPGSDGLEYRDSHFTPCTISTSKEEWKKVQGKIFQNIIDAGVMSVMITHKSFPAVDDTIINGKLVPSSLSPKVIQGLLREEMGFDGVVITDGICMAGLASICSHEEMLIRAINAGNDILLGVDPEDFDTVYQAVLDGRIPMSRIDESCERVLKMKEKIGLFDDEIRNEVIDAEEANRSVRETSIRVAEKSLTLLYDKNNLLPIKKDNIKNVTIFCISHYSGTIKELEVMKKEFEKRGAKVTMHDSVPFGDIGPAVSGQDLIIYAGYLGPHRPMGLPSFYGEKMKCFYSAFSKESEKSLGISLGYPYIHYDSMAAARTFVNMYSPDPETQKAFVRAVYGEIEFEGSSPVDIEPKVRSILC